MRLTVGILFLCLHGGIVGRTIAEQHDFSVEDSIRMSRFNDFYADGRRSSISVSPDRRHYLLLTSRGLLESNRIESTLWLLDSSSVEQLRRRPNRSTKLSPSALVKIAAVPEDTDVRTGIYSSVIARVRWSATSDSVYFLAQSVSGERRLYNVAIRTRKAVPVSPPGVDVANYDLSGSTLIFLATRASDRAGESRELRDARSSQNPAVTGIPFHAILNPTGSDRLRAYDLYAVENSKAHLVWKAEEHALPANRILWEQLTLSPDKRFAVVLTGVKTIPRAWEEYQTPPQSPTVRPINPDEPGITSPYSINPLREYALVNLLTGSFARLPALDARSLFYLGGGAPVWSGTGKRLLVTNIFLPLEGIQGAERAKRRQPCAIALFETDSRSARCLSSKNPGDSPGNGAALRGAIFGVDEDTVIASYGGDPGRTETYRLKGDDWVDVGDMDRSQTLHEQTSRIDAPLLKIKQGLNELPKLWLEGKSAGLSSIELWDPNPQLSQVRFGEASVYSWKDKSGYNWSGVLIKPAGYVTGRRYPLVIQTHGFDPNAFVTDGAYPTAMAARPLASAGIMVLQIGGRFDHLDQLDEPRDNNRAYDSAIEALSADGLVDLTRVGVIGFSRTCWYVETAIEAKPHQFAAATIADGVDFGYMQYMLYGPGDPLIQENSERMYEGRPTRGGLAKWMESAPSFNLDEVETPLRIEAIGPASVLTEWEIYSSLQMEHKPVELFYLPHGEHILQRPSDRFASEQGNVDWYRFWLLGIEDSDPAKSEQYRRWNEMKTRQTSQHPVRQEKLQD
jgi:dipeptidyl aminopeptidase/acylaminoacyl peptidase